jgi:hypothetical protein
MILNDFLELFLATEISCDKNTQTDKTKSPVTFDDMSDMVELYNQLSIYIGKADFKPIFWDNTQPFLKIIPAKLEEVAESMVAESMEKPYHRLHSILQYGLHYSGMEYKEKAR